MELLLSLHLTKSLLDGLKAELPQSFSTCVFKVITFSKLLPWIAQTSVITLKSQTHALKAHWKRLSQLSFKVSSCKFCMAQRLFIEKYLEVDLYKMYHVHVSSIVFQSCTSFTNLSSSTSSYFKLIWSDWQYLISRHLIFSFFGIFYNIWSLKKLNINLFFLYFWHHFSFFPHSVNFF